MEQHRFISMLLSLFSFSSMLNYRYPGCSGASACPIAKVSTSAQGCISSLNTLMKCSDLLKPEQILDSGQNKSTSLRQQQQRRGVDPGS